MQAPIWQGARLRLLSVLTTGTLLLSGCGNTNVIAPSQSQSGSSGFSAASTSASGSPGRFTTESSPETSPDSKRGGGKPCSSISVSLDPQTLAAGRRGQATAVVTTSSRKSGKETAISWVSSNASVATVDANGVVLAVAPGTASIQGSSSGCASAALQTVSVSATAPAPAPSVASVVVTFSAASILSGSGTQAYARAIDQNGTVITGLSVSWRSLATTVATVSSAGFVTGVSGGSVSIEATVQGVVGAAPISVTSALVTVPPASGTGNLIDATFDDGTLGSFGKWESAPGKISVIDDPAGSGRGKVARLHYGPVAARSSTSGVDDNTSLVAPITQRWGQTVFFRGEYYIDADLGGQGEPTIQRKLLYMKNHEDWTKYPTTGGHRFRTRVTSFGPDLVLDSFYEPTPGVTDTYRTLVTVPNALKSRQWFTLEVQQTMESSFGAGDGIIRVWLNGVKVIERTSMRFTYSGWKDEDVADMYFSDFLVGMQTNSLTLAFDEYRYLNNVSFSSQRLAQ